MERRYTISSSSGVDEEVGLLTPSGKKKRFRKAYSCRNCRHRKIKCDRVFPCNQCQVRGISGSCGSDTLCEEYAAADEKKRAFLQYIDDMQSKSLRPRDATAGASPSSSKMPPTSPEITLQTLYSTMTLFQDYITRVESQFNSDRECASPSFSPKVKKWLQQECEFGVPEVGVNTARYEQRETQCDLLLAQLKVLDDKINLICDKLMLIGSNVLDTSPQEASNPPTISQNSNSCMIETSSSHSKPLELINNDQLVLQSQDIEASQYSCDYCVDFNIEGWLAQDCLPLMPLTEENPAEVGQGSLETTGAAS